MAGIPLLLTIDEPLKRKNWGGKVKSSPAREG